MFGYWILTKLDYDKLVDVGWKYEPTDSQKQFGFDKPDYTDEDDIPYAMRTGGFYVECDSLDAAVKLFRAATSRPYHTDCVQPYTIR